MPSPERETAGTVLPRSFHPQIRQHKSGSALLKPGERSRFIVFRV